jgi:hypothetical protein
MVDRDMNVFHDIDEANLAIDQANEEINRLRRTLVKICAYAPYLNDGESREDYNRRMLKDMREMARLELTGEERWIANTVNAAPSKPE